MSNDPYVLREAVSALEEEDRRDIANDLRDHTDDKLRTVATISRWTKLVLFYTVLIGLPIAGTGAFLHNIYSGQFIRALFIIFYLVILWVFLAMFHQYVAGIREWFRTEGPPD